MHDDERLELGALDPTRDAPRFARARDAIAARVAPGLARRRAGGDLLSALAAWRAPVLAATSLIVLLSAVTIARVPGRGATPIPAPPAAAERGLSPSQSLLARSGVPASLWSDAGSSDPGELLQGAR